VSAPSLDPTGPDALPTGGDLGDLMRTRRVILCVGCGGVGKTTTAAALALAAARHGKRVLCLTIDPARRLAESLGLKDVRTEGQRIAPERFIEAGLVVSGSLTVMMLDTKRTFDGLVTSLASSHERRDRLLANPLYQYVSTSLAGTQEYMAMEKLYEVKDDPRFDLVVLDTPPTSHALDFLDAPERLVGALDSPAVRWLLRAFRRSSGLSLDLLARTAAAVLGGMGRIIGSGFLEQIASFAAESNELFGGWRKRADEVASALRGPEVAYVLVTTPERMCIREVLYFAERLCTQGMQPDAFVVNRVHDPILGLPTETELDEAMERRGLVWGQAGRERVLEAARQQDRLAGMDRLHMMALEEISSGACDGARRRPTIVCVPDYARDIHDLARLAWVADVLAPGAPR
jgi:anion-transporting  ArsA/GET3 family ATPase